MKPKFTDFTLSLGLVAIAIFTVGGIFFQFTPQFVFPAFAILYVVSLITAPIAIPAFRQSDYYFRFLLVVFIAAIFSVVASPQERIYQVALFDGLIFVNSVFEFCHEHIDFKAVGANIKTWFQTFFSSTK